MCKFCEQFDFSRAGYEMEHFMTGKPNIFLAGGRPVPTESRFLYCPVCGDQLGEPKKKPGHWLTVNGPHQKYGKKLYECSECCAVSDDDTEYCPHCGRKMDSTAE